MLDELLQGPWILPEPRVTLARIPRDDGTRFWILRDDLLHPVASGNKMRKLDGLLPELLHAGATDILTLGGLQSSHAASVAALAAEHRLHATVLLRGEPPEQPTGYALLSELFGHVVYVERDQYANREALLGDWAGRLEAEGRTVAVIPEGAADVRALRGLVRLVRELALQLPEPYGTRYELVVDAGTGTTAIGLAVGVALMGLKWTVNGVCLMRDELEQYQQLERRLYSQWEKRHGPLPKTPSILWSERSRPRRFGDIQPGELERCRDLARRTGILFDPLYTLAAYDFIEGLRSKEAQRALLVHSGGTLNMFGLTQRFGASYLRS